MIPYSFFLDFAPNLIVYICSLLLGIYWTRPSALNPKTLLSAFSKNGIIHNNLYLWTFITWLRIFETWSIDNATTRKLAFFLGAQSKIALSVCLLLPVAKTSTGHLRKSSTANLCNVIINKVRKAVTVVRQRHPKKTGLTRILANLCILP